MEQIFNFVINAVDKGVKSSLSPYVILLAGALPLFSCLVELTLNACLKKNTSGEVTKSVSTVSILISIIFSVGSLFFNGLNYLTPLNVFYYNATLILVCYIAYITAKTVGKFCYKPLKIKEEVEEDKKDLAPTNVKRIVETITCKPLSKPTFSGYLNVEYLRELVAQLKKCDLSEEELSEIEDFEVYLLNFVTRQPNSEERLKLSNYIGLLFKKLAKYNVVNE